MNKPSRRLAAALLAVGLAALGGNAHAIGRLADIRVIDRTTGRNLPIHVAHGKYWVAGAPGTRYAIAVHNRGGARILAVTAVDGVNAVSGETAAWDQTGYVLAPRQRYEILGWRKSDAEVAAFEFTALGDSYAARTGRAANVGVIGVALFRERPQIQPEPQVPPLTRTPSFESGADASASPAPAPETAGADSSAKSASGAAAERNEARSALQRERLGTGHGARETSWVDHTEFERAQTHPDEIVTIHYDRLANLIALGVLPAVVPPAPNPFPAAQAGYVPDPPPRR